MDALSSQVYAIQLPTHLLAQPSAPAPFLPEDIHICGNCKQSFTDIRYFLQHKNECNAFLSSATAALLESASSSVNLQLLGQDQPLLQVMINEESQSVLVQSPQQNADAELNTTEDSNGAANVLAAAATLLECGNVSISNERRDIQIDEEDVASLLANQFAKEAVYIPPDSPSDDNSETTVPSEICIEDKTRNSKVVDCCNNNTAVIADESPIDAVKNLLENVEGSGRINNNKNVSNDNGHTRIDNGQIKNSKKDLQYVNINVQVVGSAETSQEPSILPAKRLTYCNLCSFVTMYPSDLTRHMRKHTGERPFECTVCSQRFPRRDKLQTHLRIHTGEKPYRCQFCDYAAIDSGPLRKHLRTHTDERPFKCQFCPYSAKDTSQLTVHLRTHTGDAPFVCQFAKCGRAFKTSTDLKRHGVVHKRVHPFACKLCDYKATNRLNLQAHYQLSHNALIIDNNVFKCVASGCDFKTSDVNDFEMHQLKLHPVPDILNLDDSDIDCRNSRKKKYNSRVSAGNRSHTCNFCSHEARTQSSLKQHVRKQHSNSGSGNNASTGGSVKSQSRPMCQKAHHCTYCSASFVRQDSLRSHLKQHQNNNSDIVPPHDPPPSDPNKDQFDSVSSDLIGSGSFFIDNIIGEEYISM